MGKESFKETLNRYVGKDKPLTQADVSRRLNVSMAAVSRWMDGRIPETKLFVALADLLNMSPRELLGTDYRGPFAAEAAPAPRQGRPPNQPPPSLGDLLDTADLEAAEEEAADEAPFPKPTAPARPAQPRKRRSV